MKVKLPDGSEARFRLVRKKNMRRIILHMEPDGDNWISMPETATLGAARDVAEANVDWIMRQRDALASEKAEATPAGAPSGRSGSVRVQLPDGSEATFRLVRKSNMRRIILHMGKGEDYWISMPTGATDEDARKAAEAHLDWIMSQRAAAEGEATEAGEETVSYLGRRYPLVYESSPFGKAYVKDDKFYITGPTREYADEFLKLWWKQEALLKCHESAAEWYSKLGFSKLGVRFPRISVRDMKTRWGSCTWTQGTIRVNSRVLEKDEDLIDYVVLHEMAHLLYPNHEESFHKYLTEQMPDWKERRARLNQRT